MVLGFWTSDLNNLIYGIEKAIIINKSMQTAREIQLPLNWIWFLWEIAFPVQLDEELILLKGKSGVLRVFLKLEFGNSPLPDVGRTDVPWRMKGGRTLGSSGGDCTIHCSADFRSVQNFSQ